MVVDDEEDICYLLNYILTKAGHEVVTASSGEEALEKLKTEKPDLIILDIMMPGLDGFETCKRIKSNEETRSITVTMLTVKFNDEDRIKSMEDCGAEWHITKPIDKNKLVGVVDWLLKYPPRRVG